MLPSIPASFWNQNSIIQEESEISTVFVHRGVIQEEGEISTVFLHGSVIQEEGEISNVFVHGSIIQEALSSLNKCRESKFEHGVC